jgi:hypothetical protein
MQSSSSLSKEIGELPNSFLSRRLEAEVMNFSKYFLIDHNFSSLYGELICF